MKTKIRWFLVLGMAAMGAATAQGTIQWNYASPLTVTEKITDAGGIGWRYTYSLTNTDTSPIWRFGVFTRNYIITPEKAFTNKNWLIPGFVENKDIYQAYDARNLDGSISGMIFSDYEGGLHGSPSLAIQINETATGFSYISADYDPNPKYYFYETIASGYTRTNGTGNVAAVGMTVPEPGMIILLVSGFLILRKRQITKG